MFNMKQSILFIEDDRLFAGIISEMRQFVDAVFCGDMQLVTLQTLAMAKHVIATGNVALVIMDLTLPDSTQKDTVALIANEHGTWPPIYVLTGDERIEVRKECLLGGAAGFALKKHAIESPNQFFAGLYNTYIRHLREHGNRI